jgi:hypothetical protein
MWGGFSHVFPADDAEPSDEAVRTANESWIAWMKVYGEMSIVASDEVWRLTEPWFDEMRSA